MHVSSLLRLFTSATAVYHFLKRFKHLEKMRKAKEFQHVDCHDFLIRDHGRECCQYV